jgi:hypothetical protein
VHQVSRHQEKPCRSKDSRLAPLPVVASQFLGISQSVLYNFDPNCAKNVPRSFLYLPPFLVFFFTPPPKRMAF